MPRQSDPYSRIYWRYQTDPKFDSIREDVAVMGAWLALLVAADRSWPTPAYVPSFVPRRCLERLVAAELVDLDGRHRFRIHGLDRERERRATQARQNRLGGGTDA